MPHPWALEKIFRTRGRFMRCKKEKHQQRPFSRRTPPITFPLLEGPSPEMLPKNCSFQQKSSQKFDLRRNDPSLPMSFNLQLCRYQLANDSMKFCLDRWYSETMLRWLCCLWRCRKCIKSLWSICWVYPIASNSGCWWLVNSFLKDCNNRLATATGHGLDPKYMLKETWGLGFPARHWFHTLNPEEPLLH